MPRIGTKLPVFGHEDSKVLLLGEESEGGLGVAGCDQALHEQLAQRLGHRLRQRLVERDG